MSDLTARLLADTERELEELVLSNGEDLEAFLLLSLEREQVAAIAYSEALIIHRLAQLDVIRTRKVTPVGASCSDAFPMALRRVSVVYATIRHRCLSRDR